LGSSRQISILDTALLVQTLFNKSNLVEPGKLTYRDDQVMNLRPNLNYLNSLGWKETVTLKEGLLDLIDFNNSGASRYLNIQ
jgi:nucleoside-diphosphate-sugar epimerase